MSANLLCSLASYVVGNILVLITVWKFMGKANVTNIYIANLAVADFLVVVICVPFKVIYRFRNNAFSAVPITLL